LQVLFGRDHARRDVPATNNRLLRPILQEGDAHNTNAAPQRRIIPVRARKGRLQPRLPGRQCAIAELPVDTREREAGLLPVR